MRAPCHIKTLQNALRFAFHTQRRNQRPLSEPPFLQTVDFFGSHFSTAQMPKHDDAKDAASACKKEVAAYERLSKIKGAAQT